MPRRFENKVIVITGSSEGVGKDSALRFAKEGGTVVLAARRKEPLEAARAEIEAIGGKALALPTDVGDIAACRALVEQTLEAFGRIDVLVNNAGAHYRGPVVDRTPEEMATMVDVNARAPLVLSRLALDALKDSRGVIVNVASIAGQVPLPDAATYSATKFALRAFSIALGQELKGTGVRVSLVSPGPILDTGFLMSSIEEAADVVFAQPMSTSAEVADMIVACAVDGRRERVKPLSSSILATAAYLLPGLRDLLEPAMKAKGRRMKEHYLKQRRAEAERG